MSEVKYSGKTRHFAANLVDDGGYVVDVKQKRKLDPYRDAHGMSSDGEVEEQITEVAADRAELRDIFNRCFPE